MRIGIDATCWWSLRGFGRFTRELLKAMIAAPGNNTFVLFIDRPADPEMLKDNVEIVQVLQSRPITEAAIVSDRRSISDLFAFRKAVAKQSLDLFYFPAVYSWYPVPFGLPVVVTLHDAIAEHFPDMIFPHWKGRLMWRLKMRLARWQATKIMTVSHAAKNEIIQHLGISAKNIEVITEAADPIFKPINELTIRTQIREKYLIPKDARYIVYVGGLAPHKNLSGFVKGLSLAVERGGIDDLHFILVGDPEGDGFHSNYNELLTVIKQQSGLNEKVHFTGYVSDEDLVVLYSDALAVTLPSFSEGFGLPAIEAMACHVPVLASKAGSIPEVVGDAGLYFDPYNSEEISEAIFKMASDDALLETLRQKAITRAGLFCWSNAAKLAMQCLENIKK